MKNRKDGKIIEGDFREVNNEERKENEMNEEMTLNEMIDEIMKNDELTVEEKKAAADEVFERFVNGNETEEKEWTMKDLEEVRKKGEIRKKMKKLVIGVAGTIVVGGAVYMIAKKFKEKEPVDVEAVISDVKTVVEETTK